MKAKEYELLARCVEDGVSRGFARAYKHTETPDEGTFKTELENAVLLEICEWFDFDFGVNDD